MGNFLLRYWWGGHPDEVNAFSGLTLRDIHHLQTTWAPVYLESGKYGMEMFLRLFRKDPNTQTFFKTISKLEEHQIIASYQFQAHVRSLMSSINICVVNLKEPEIVAALMEKLGETHGGRGIEKAHFEEFKEIWTEVLKVDLQVSSQVMASWVKFINFMYKHIYGKLNK